MCGGFFFGFIKAITVLTFMVKVQLVSCLSCSCYNLYSAPYLWRWRCFQDMLFGWGFYVYKIYVSPKLITTKSTSVVSSLIPLALQSFFAYFLTFPPDIIYAWILISWLCLIGPCLHARECAIPWVKISQDSSSSLRTRSFHYKSSK